ncbi:MAG: hypothetical protein EXR51_04725 [Dehalococcoidia bacterium]|nr:hypothetical protein [Dehalococcoidia bacterium]
MSGFTSGGGVGVARVRVLSGDGRHRLLAQVAERLGVGSAELANAIHRVSQSVTKDDAFSIEQRRLERARNHLQLPI